MESLSICDVRFLIALHASEESSLVELRNELAGWDAEGLDVARLLHELIDGGFVLMAKITLQASTDFSISQSLELASRWETTESIAERLFLTETGFLRWEADDWGISTERARHLMFPGKGGVTRVSASA
jgi:hypothetical protein